MKDSVPKPFNERAVRQAMSARGDPDPLKVVLLQEVQRYNKLLVFAHTTIQDLINAMLGISTVTPLLDTIIEAFLEFKVPAKWGFAYPSLKPLAAWTRDLIARTDQLEGWWTAKMPTVYWLPGLT